MQSKIIIRNQSGVLVGIVNKKSATTLYIVCHGYGGSKDDHAVSGLSEELARHGFSTFRFDFSGTGESTGPAGILAEKQTEDLLRIVDYFRSFLKIILIGGSLGAIPVVTAALKSTRVSAVITVNGFFGTSPRDSKYLRIFLWMRMLTIFVPRFRSAYQQLLQSFKPENITVPVLVICTTYDRIIDYRQSVNFYNSLTGTNKRLAILPLEAHDLSGNGDVQKVVRKIISWKINDKDT